MIVVKPLEKNAAVFLHDLCQSIFLDGECYAFAIALHRYTGLPLVGLIDQDTIRHAAVRCPEDGMLFDARGKVSEEEFREPFSKSPCCMLDSIEEKDLTEIRPVHETTIERAALTAGMLWPDLPWNKTSFLSRVRAFAKDLEEISCKHGIWIRAIVPGSPPILTQAFGDEGGYDVRPTLDGQAFTIDRSLVIECSKT